MTKEEAIEILTRIMNNNFYGGEVQMACKLGIEALSHPSPNLDEAAERYSCYDEDCEGAFYEPIVRNAFKAGAEWMSGQGETHELTVESPVLGPPMICCPVHADNGDKVVVQIRKK